MRGKPRIAPLRKGSCRRRRLRGRTLRLAVSPAHLKIYVSANRSPRGVEDAAPYGRCVTDVSAATHPRRLFSPCGEREGGDTLPHNEGPHLSLALHRAKSLRNFVTFAHAHRRFGRVFNWPNLCNVYKIAVRYMNGGADVWLLKRPFTTNLVGRTVPGAPIPRRFGRRCLVAETSVYHPP